MRPKHSQFDTSRARKKAPRCSSWLSLQRRLASTDGHTPRLSVRPKNDIDTGRLKAWSRVDVAKIKTENFHRGNLSSHPRHGGSPAHNCTSGGIANRPSATYTASGSPLQSTPKNDLPGSFLVDLRADRAPGRPGIPPNVRSAVFRPDAGMGGKSLRGGCGGQSPSHVSTHPHLSTRGISIASELPLVLVLISLLDTSE